MRIETLPQRSLLGGAAVVLAAVLLLATASCEVSAVLAPSDGQMIINTGSPVRSTDPGTGEEIVTVPIVVQVLNASSFPQAGIDISFFADGGTLASGGAAITADINGVARDTLTLRLGDPATVEVTAQSGSLNATIEVRNSLLGNAPPVADFVLQPAGEQSVDRLVRFDGSGSSDPDGDPITCFEWTIDSTVDSNDEVVLGLRSFSRQYAVEQDLAVRLRVSDEAAARANCSAGRPVDPALFSPDDFSLGYRIVCANQRPTAEAGSNIVAQLPAGGGPATVTLNGTGSTDPDTPPIDEFRWECGTTSTPRPTGNPAIVECDYGFAGTFTARLTVTDGIGDCSMNVANCVCPKTHTDTVQVTVQAAPAP